jgi:ribosome-associated protein
LNPDSRQVVAVRSEPIRLGQLLKLAGIVDSGAEVKLLLGAAQVTVNGAAESRRGRQLVAGDVVAVDGTELVVALSSAGG